uniref:Uncharacterized protein n=1 Tax=Noctiluca scintillans TaxID=2966 RepID=A0A7S0ZZ33_NOCSC|mmetsp:Transcript_2454/g.7196  ORF Transcript_2454/g.7196 Transcript_2454/m.7196 type:complete len:280 (+) Transcript_2454:66-905(+)|eukprot:CAMPEP_0194480466 /NCGR_PEP_ID=MMETSP0253-20130528/3257_1 /TAXON_ID=2966 /ORGANISM="Noctiluca scintillans" /LENGTH=279 /DNA_ID=CAMNT_0039319853 /DNA_START=56 /DNA_END=895 /DNA_ORIENTATION=+
MADDDDEPKYEFRVQGSDKKTEGGSANYTGQGKAKYIDGDTYEGTYVEGSRAGKGIYIHKKNGDKYEGHYEQNKKSGFGKMTYSSTLGEEEDGDEPDPNAPPRGGFYLGFYTNGVRGGKRLPPGDKDPFSDRRTEGTFTYANGDMYVGEWEEGKKHGKGTYSFAKDSTQMIGDWDNGRMTHGQWTFPNGTFYSGKFRYNKPHGKGVWVFKTGNQLVGEYEQKEIANEEEEPPLDDAEEVEKPDPKIWCHFRPERETAVRGGTMFGPKCGNIPLVPPPLD